MPSTLRQPVQHALALAQAQVDVELAQQGPIRCPRFVAVALTALTLVLTSSPVLAGAVARGSAGFENTTQDFWGAHGSGRICIALKGGFASNDPGAGAANRCETGFVPPLGNAFGVEKVTPKADPGTTTDAFSDSIVAGIYTLSGIGSWAYDAGSLTSSATYTALSTINPKPVGPGAVVAGGLIARTTSTDPAQFEADGPGFLTVSAMLHDLALEPAPSGEAIFSTGEAFDGEALFTLVVRASGGSSGLDDLDIQYTSILGPAWEATVIADLLSKLSFDATAGAFQLNSQVVLFPTTQIAYEAGAHEVAHGVQTLVNAAPEPATGVLASTLLAMLLLLHPRWRAHLREAGRQRAARRAAAASAGAVQA